MKSPSEIDHDKTAKVNGFSKKENDVVAATDSGIFK
jgi:hypothetical protein